MFSHISTKSCDIHFYFLQKQSSYSYHYLESPFTKEEPALSEAFPFETPTKNPSPPYGLSFIIYMLAGGDRSLKCI